MTNIKKQTLIDCINKCKHIDDIIEDEIDNIIEKIGDDIIRIENKYGIEIWTEYKWDFKDSDIE